MALTMKQISLPAVTITLTSLASIIDKAIIFTQTKKINESVLLQYRLAPDMFPFVRQIQIATDLAKNGLSRLADVEALRLEDNEISLAELKQRIETTINYIDGLNYEAINNSQDNNIIFPLGPIDRGQMLGEDYLNHFILPNFYFHVAMAYAILRHCGVELGKRDFLGEIPIKIS
jgi:hypothetical protein